MRTTTGERERILKAFRVLILNILEQHPIGEQTNRIAYEISETPKFKSFGYAKCLRIVRKELEQMVAENIVLEEEKEDRWVFKWRLPKYKGISSYLAVKNKKGEFECEVFNSETEEFKKKFIKPELHK